MLSEEYLQLICDLTQKEKRQSAAKKIAKLMGISELMFFVHDPETQIFIPALGLEHNITNIPGWQNFLTDSVLHKKHTTSLGSSMVTGISSRDNDSKDCVMVVLGKPREPQMLVQLEKLLPMVAACLRFELFCYGLKNPLQSLLLEVGFLKRTLEKVSLPERSMERLRSLDTHFKKMTALLSLKGSCDDSVSMSSAN